MTTVLDPRNKLSSLRVDDAGALLMAGSVTQAVPDYDSAADLLAAYGNFSGVDRANGAFVSRQGTSNGQIFTALSVSPLDTGESRIVVNAPVKQPCKLEFEASIVRNRLVFASVGLFADDVINGVTTPATVPDPINIVNISQSTAVSGAAYTGTAGTVATITLQTALPAWPAANAVYLSDWINILGFVDTRLNYQNAAISFISADRKVITVGFSDEIALTSLAIPVVTPSLGTAKVVFYNNAAGAHHGAGYRFTGVTDTSAAIWTVFGGGDAQISGTLLGDHRISILSSAPTLLNGVYGNYEMKATSRFVIKCEPERTTFLERTVDSATAYSLRAIRSAVKPGSEALLRPRFRIYQPEGMSRPVAKIVSAVKATASSTATINLDVAPATPLAVGNVVSIYGVRDQVNFVGSTVTIASVISPTSFTAAIGPAVIATSYGGFVSIINGGAAQPGIIGQYGSVIGTNIGGQPDWLNCTFNTTVSGVAIGMYVNLHGWRQDLTGADLLVDGAWEIAHASASTVWFKPIYAIDGTRVSPVTPNIATPVNCGGGLIIRTTARLHDLIFDSQGGVTRVEVDGAGTSDVSKAIPVNLVSGGVTTVTTTEGTLVTPAAYTAVSAASTNAALIKSTAGTAYSLGVSNLTAATIYVKLYNKATAPTVGTDIPLRTFPVLAGQPIDINFGRTGVRFSLGIGIAITAAQAATDTTVVAAGAQTTLSYI